jgi:arginase family enzyme
VNVALITVPYDSGHHGQRFGAGPQAILDAGLAGRLERCGHRGAVCRAVAAEVRATAAGGAFPIVIAARLSLAGMTVSAYDPALDRDAAVPEAVADLLVECLATMDGRHA